MINNNNDLVFGLYLAIIIFFAGYWFMGNDREKFMKNTTLNWIFIAFFIVIFFLIGYLFKNLLLSFVDFRNKKTSDIK